MREYCVWCGKETDEGIFSLGDSATIEFGEPICFSCVRKMSGVNYWIDIPVYEAGVSAARTIVRAK